MQCSTVCGTNNHHLRFCSIQRSCVPGNNILYCSSLRFLPVNTKSFFEVCTYIINPICYENQTLSLVDFLYA